MSKSSTLYFFFLSQPSLSYFSSILENTVHSAIHKDIGLQYAYPYKYAEKAQMALDIFLNTE